MPKLTGCKHFTGIQNDVCEKGIRYADILIDASFPCRLPCTGHEQCNNSIDCFEPYTQEESAKWEQDIADFLSRFDSFNQRKTEDCPHCGKHVETLEQVRRCYYARPCGCRVASWRCTRSETVTPRVHAGVGWLKDLSLKCGNRDFF